MPQRQVSMNEIRIDKLAFTFKKTICHYYILLYKIFQEARRRIKHYCSIIKAVCKQQLQEEKNIKFSFDQFLGSNPGSITVVTLQLRYTDLISFIA